MKYIRIFKMHHKPTGANYYFNTWPNDWDLEDALNNKTLRGYKLKFNADDFEMEKPRLLDNSTFGKFIDNIKKLWKKSSRIN